MGKKGFLIDKRETRFYLLVLSITLCLFRAATVPKIHPIAEVLPVVSLPRLVLANQKALNGRGQICARENSSFSPPNRCSEQ